MDSTEDTNSDRSEEGEDEEIDDEDEEFILRKLPPPRIDPVDPLAKTSTSENLPPSNGKYFTLPPIKKFGSAKKMNLRHGEHYFGNVGSSQRSSRYLSATGGGDWHVAIAFYDKSRPSTPIPTSRFQTNQGSMLRNNDSRYSISGDVAQTPKVLQTRSDTGISRNSVVIDQVRPYDDNSTRLLKLRKLSKLLNPEKPDYNRITSIVGNDIDASDKIGDSRQQFNSNRNGATVNSETVGMKLGYTA